MFEASGSFGRYPIVNVVHICWVYWVHSNECLIMIGIVTQLIQRKPLLISKYKDLANSNVAMLLSFRKDIIIPYKAHSKR